VWKRICIGKNKALYDVIFDDYADLDIFCSVLADYILKSYPESIARRFIKANYRHIQPDETFKNICSEAKNIPYYDKQKLRAMLKDYISANDTLVLDGFVQFRLKEYVEAIKSAVTEAVSRAEAKHEYDEFIKLLKFFVDIQNPVVETVHIIKTENRYIISDESYSEISNDYMEDFRRELKYGNINYDDLLLSALITLAPNKIYIHNYEDISNKELLLTLKKIFNKKLIFCNDADMPDLNNNCENKVNISENTLPS